MSCSGDYPYQLGHFLPVCRSGCCLYFEDIEAPTVKGNGS